ncbi:substrate-binding domain-containing protein [Kitasatospora sp. NPDC093558]|uniref:PstS family phosphate ABC transporter substrate-binding protein n=1 Tax=Kitasatospora sp. NPDC093558 TaxID=3155201 RepID=UPI003439D6A1
MRKTAAKLLTAAALATSLVTIASGSALADPTVTPAAQDIVGAGSDTTQAVLNQLSTSYNATLTDPTAPRLYSWDATGSSPITPKTGASTITRPNGSGAGINALNATTSATLDFARSSRGPVSGPTGDPATDDFVAMAKDAVSWAAPSNGHAPANLTTQNLKDIYTCNVTNWTQIDPTLTNATIKPFLPQKDSGTRAFFLKAIGSGTSVTPGACVIQGTQENQGSDPALADLDAVVPYSVAHYIGQVYFNQGSGSDVQGPLTIRSVDGIAPVDVPNKKISDAFAASSYARVVYNVIRDAEWTGTDAHAAALQNIFGNGGFICSSAGASVLQSYGFLPLQGFDCGSSIHS